MNPTNRREAYLAKMAGMDVECPEPVSREEAYMAQIAENAGGGSGGVNFVTISVPAQESYVVLQVGNEVCETHLTPDSEDCCYLYSTEWYEKVKAAIEKFPVAFTKAYLGTAGETRQYGVAHNGVSVYTTHIDLGSVSSYSVIIWKSND